MTTWFDRLCDQRTRLDTHMALARSWTTCAVGEAQQAYPGVIRDPSFRRLGIAFLRAVRKNRRTTATRLYLTIQRRAFRLYLAIQQRALKLAK